MKINQLAQQIKNINLRIFKRDINPFWRRFFYFISFLGTGIVGFIFLLKIINYIGFNFLGGKFVVAYSWLSDINIFLFFFIMVVFVIINRVLSQKINEKITFWFLASLLFLNFVWGIGLNNYQKYGIQQFDINLYYLVIFLGLLSLRIVWTKITYFINLNIKFNNKISNIKKKRVSVLSDKRQEYTKKFPKLSTIPLIRTFMWWGYRVGWIHIIVLITIIIVFIAIRLPYFNDSFIIRLHPGKYTSYVPTAQEMYEAKNPFVFRNTAYTSLFEYTEDQRFNNFWRMPTIEWTMAPFFMLENILSDEAIVRIYLTLFGILILLNLYILIRKILSPFVALAITFLFILTPVFNLLTWTTTLDLPAFLFLLISLNLFLYKREDLAFLILGFSFLTKSSFIIIGLTLFGLLILFIGKEKIIRWMKLILLSIIPLILFNILLRKIPSYPEQWIRNILLILGFFIILVIIYKLIKLPLTRILMKIQQKKIFWYSSVIFVVLLFLVLLPTVLWKSFSTLSGQFLTDSTLLFNFSFYSELFNKIRFMSIPTVTQIFMVSLLVFWLLPKNKFKILISLLLTSFVYLVLASKSIRFGWYYNHFFILTIFLFAGGLLYQIEKTLPFRRNAKMLGIVALVVISILTIYPRPSYVLQNNISKEAIQYIIDKINPNLQSNDKIISYSSANRTFYLYIDKPVLSLANITDSSVLNKIRNDIKAVGFYETMMNYNFRYMIDTHGKDSFISLVYLFTDETDQISGNRTDIILARLDNNTDYYNKLIQDLYITINPKQYFKQIGTIQNVTIYEIVPSQDF